VRANGKGRSIPRQDSGPSTTIAILTAQPDAVVDLAAYRARRAPAAGYWWGPWRMHTWDQAEASRRPA